MNCKDCKYWVAPTEDYYGYFGDCKNDAFIENCGNYDDYPKNALVYWDYEGYSAGFTTGPEFGCIHFKNKL